MAKKKIPLKNKKISVILQTYRICSYYKNIIYKKEQTSNKVKIYFKIKPCDFCRVFSVRMEYSNSMLPRIYVINPDIYEENNKKPEHIYDWRKGRICLFMPKEINFSSYYDVIIPWISEWIFYYEIWRITGNWDGGGHKGVK